MYESPIEVIHKNMRTQLDNEVYKAVLDVCINVDKDELIRALQYDRRQYEKGYADGMAAAEAKIAASWEAFEKMFIKPDIPKIVRCKDCKHWDNGYKFCRLHGVDCYGSSPFGENSYCSRGEKKRRLIKMTYLEAAKLGKFKDLTIDHIMIDHCPTPLCIPNDKVGFDKCSSCWNREIPKEEEMKIKERFKIEHPGLDVDQVANERCPSVFGYPNDPDCPGHPSNPDCDKCWDREISDVRDSYVPKADVKVESCDVENNEGEFNFVKATPVIKDSGNRREFETGAVRDIQEGKGRCDLMPLDVVADFMEVDPYERDWVLWDIEQFQRSGTPDMLYIALSHFGKKCDWTGCTMFLEVSKHFEEGAKKYGENNWQKGIPTHCYIDSAVRHYLKYLRGDTDEPHDRAFVWNLMCCIWTCIHKPELNDYCKKEN